MPDRADPVTVLERVRELEGEIAELLRGLGEDEASDTASRVFQCLEIGVGEGRFLIPIDDIREVVPVVWPEPVAGAPDWVMGSASYGTVPTTLIDLGLRIHDVSTELTPSLLMVVVESTRWLGLVVSSVGEIRRVDASELTTPGSDIPSAGFLLGIARFDDGTSVPVLSVRRVGRDLDG